MKKVKIKNLEIKTISKLVGSISKAAPKFKQTSSTETSFSFTNRRESGEIVKQLKFTMEKQQSRNIWGS